MGFAIAYDPCQNCGKKEMCSMCELTMRRNGAIKENEREQQEQEHKLVRDAFLELKREIHSRAVHTHSRDVYDFINIKVFDAVLQNQIRKYTEENGENA